MAMQHGNVALLQERNIRVLNCSAVIPAPHPYWHSAAAAGHSLCRQRNACCATSSCCWLTLLLHPGQLACIPQLTKRLLYLQGPQAQLDLEVQQPGVPQLEIPGLPPEADQKGVQALVQPQSLLCHVQPIVQQKGIERGQQGGGDAHILSAPGSNRSDGDRCILLLPFLPCSAGGAACSWATYLGQGIGASSGQQWPGAGMPGTATRKLQGSLEWAPASWLSLALAFNQLGEHISEEVDGLILEGSQHICRNPLQEQQQRGHVAQGVLCLVLANMLLQVVHVDIQ